jgi:putative hydrolase of HD superfamily
LTSVKEIIKFIQYSENLKNIPRTGWSLAGVDSSQKESVAEHSYGAIMIAILIGGEMKLNGEEIDIEKIILMTALHDLPESIIGDIASTEEFLENKENVKQKVQAERKAINNIVSPLGEKFQHLIQLWYEYNQGDTIEAKIVRGADILDMLFHARMLEDTGTSPEVLDQFFKSSQSQINSLSINLVSEIYKELSNAHEKKREKR